MAIITVRVEKVNGATKHLYLDGKEYRYFPSFIFDVLKKAGMTMMSYGGVSIPDGRTESSELKDIEIACNGRIEEGFSVKTPDHPDFDGDLDDYTKRYLPVWLGETRRYFPENREEVSEHTFVA